jgi:diguanylate cyclase (GGDEF)-like protein
MTGVEGVEGGGTPLVDLSESLADAVSGLDFVYRCLDYVVARWGLRDAVVVVETGSLGRQAFRAGRRPIDGGWVEHVALHAPPGLHTDPMVVEDEGELEAAANLCAVALRMDVLEYDALHDPLTGLYNRRSFEGHLAHAFARSHRYGWAFSLVFVDLDHFKSVNDRLGHAAGDEVLRSVGSELRRALRRGDVAARIGGDEFALILPETDSGFVPALIERLRQDLRKLGHEPETGFSVGVASCPEEAASIDELSRLADGRLYEAKMRARLA